MFEEEIGSWKGSAKDQNLVIVKDNLQETQIAEQHSIKRPKEDTLIYIVLHHVLTFILRDRMTEHFLKK